MTTSSPLFASSATATAIAIAVILLASNFTIINAQQPQQVTNQPGVFGNGITTGTTIFQSTNDSFSIQVPDGWVAHDINNTGSALQDEITRGYGLLAQLCPEDGQQQQQADATLPNASGTPACQTAENNVIHIIRYPNLDTTLSANTTANTTTTATNNMTIDSVLTYHLQKLQEVGYNNIQIVNTTDIQVNLTNPQTDQPVATESARSARMTYTTASAPDETKIGYFILTYTDATAPLSDTNATSPNLGTTKGYAVFYEGNSSSNNATIGTTTTAGGLALAALSPAVAQVFDSFELMVAPEVAQALAQQAAQSAATTEEAAAVEEEAAEEEEEEEAAEEEEEEEGGDDDDGGNGGDDDDGGNGGDDDDGGNGGNLADCIIMGGGNVVDDCDFTPDAISDDDDGGGGDDDGA